MKRLFLSGSLLLAAFCVQAQDFVTRNGSVSLFGERPFEGIRGDNHEVSGTMDTATGDVEFHTVITSFHFRNKSIEKAFDKKYMEADRYPETSFVGKILDLSGVNFHKPGTYAIRIGGNFTIHNVTRWVSHPAVLIVKEEGLVAESQFTVKPEGFRVKVPRLLGKRLVKEINVLVRMSFRPEESNR